MFTKNKPNHSTRRRLSHWFTNGVLGDTYRHFDVHNTIRTQNWNFWNFWIEPRIFKLILHIIQ
jgi:hypothetical protein